jgi:guanyl-specific ribonuclease Sa
MRRAVFVFIAVALTLTAVAVAVRQDPGGGRVARPPASGPVGEEASGPASSPTIASAPAGRRGPAASAAQALERARDVLAAIEARRGEPLAGYVGGRAFHNRERRLPAGQYREYDLHPRVPGQDRGPERLVIDQTTGRAYYTGDHYRTFVPLN